jgi:hypothetical protein
MRDVKVFYTATDQCSAVTSVLSVVSNEEQGNENDWEIIDSHRVRLRAERLGTGRDRVYTITITSTDASGNSTSQNVDVVVPHDQGDYVTQNRINTKNDKGLDLTNGLKVIVSPNPSSNHFTIHTQSVSELPVTIKVTDNAGRVIEVRRSLPANGELLIGSLYKAGVYFIEIMQGKQVKTLKLLKTGK